jgi:LAO/AO transport system kinase
MAPPVIKTSSLNGEGLSHLWTAINDHHHYLQKNEIYRSLEQERARSDTMDILELRWREYVRKHLDSDGQVKNCLDQVIGQKMDPYTAATKILEFLLCPQTNDSSKF